jgi:two-component system cell cycle response regulator
VGLATVESPDDTPETLFKRADNALYAAKKRGRNRVAVDAA